MAMQSWKVKLFVALDAAEAKAHGKAAEAVDAFGVQASGMDQARVAARKWLEDRGYKVRSVNFTTTARELVAYVERKPAEKKKAPPALPKAGGR